MVFSRCQIQLLPFQTSTIYILIVHPLQNKKKSILSLSISEFFNTDEFAGINLMSDRRKTI